MQILNTPGKVVLVTAILLISFICARWTTGGHHFSRFIVFGENYVQQQQLPVGTLVLPGDGYDGQYFYRFSVAPMSQESYAAGVTTNAPAYRQQRILYPILVWLASGFGHPDLVPLMMVLVNLLALLLITWLFARLAALSSLPLWLAIFPALSNGLLLSLGRDTAEPVTVLCLMMAIYALKKHRQVQAGGALSLGVLARETMIIPALMSLVSRWKSGLTGWAYLVLLLPLAVFFVWQSFLWWYWGAFSWQHGVGNLGLPLLSLLTSIWERLNDLINGQQVLFNIHNAVHLIWVFWLLKLVFPLAWPYITSAGLRKTDVSGSAIALSWLAWLLLISLFTSLIWVEFWSYARVTAEWSILGWALLFHKARFPGYPFVFYTFIMMSGDMLMMLLTA